MSDNDSKPLLARRARLRFDETRQEHVLLMPERVIQLSETAAEILQLCDGTRDERELIAALEDRYPGADLTDDVMEFLSEARSRRWLEAPQQKGPGSA